MLQRKDLAKEFSLVVQQEIKNHSDMVLACNIAMDEFRRLIKEISATSDERIKILHNRLTGSIEEISRLETSIKDSLSSMNRAFNDANAMTKSHLDSIRKSMDERESYFLTIEGFKEFEKKIDQWTSHLKLSFALQRDHLANEITSTSKILMQSIASYQKEVSERFLLEMEKQKDLNKTLDLFALNFEGVRREVEICKKRCFVIEKNIENLYIQIERTQAGTK